MSVLTDRPRGAEADQRAREAEQDRHRARRRLRLALVLLVLLALVGAVGGVVWFSPLLATRSVRVSGTKVVSDAQVRTVAGVRSGLPLVRQDLAGIAAAVATLKPVRTVTVSRQWPHTVRIAVVERTPLLAVRQGSGYLLVDDQGVGFRTVAAAPAAVVTAVVDPADRAEVTAAGVVAAALPRSLRTKVAELSVAGADAITLRLEDGDSVFWGGAEQSVQKAAVTRELIKQPGHSYNVSAPLNPGRR